MRHIPHLAHTGSVLNTAKKRDKKERTKEIRIGAFNQDVSHCQLVSAPERCQSKSTGNIMTVSLSIPPYIVLGRYF